MNNLEKVMEEKDPETSPESTVSESLASTSQNETVSPEVPQNANMDEETDISEDPAAKKVDKSQFSDMQKAEYSFRKQLGKQKSRYESQLAEQRKAYEDLQSRLERLENPDKYKTKLRDSFQTDDEYIDYIVQQRMDKILDEQNRRNLIEREQEAMDEEFHANIDRNIASTFKTESEKQDYYNTVKAAFDRGLEELMDQEKNVADYIMKSPTGPRLLYELAKDPGKVKQIYSQRDPMSRLFELKMIERDLVSKPIQQSPNLQKPIGKPGISKNDTADLFASKDELRSFIRHR